MEIPIGIYEEREITLVSFKKVKDPTEKST